MSRSEKFDSDSIFDPSEFKTVDAWLSSLTRKKHDANKHVKILLSPLAVTLVPHNYLWPNLKEFSECVAAVTGVCNYLKKDLKIDRSLLQDARICCYVIGDGVRPQTGGMIASFTQWQVFSIDPALQMDKYRDKISSLPNLKMYKQKAEDFEQFPKDYCCLLYTSPSPRDGLLSRMPSSA